jgi:hypothetical protein
MTSVLTDSVSLHLGYVRQWYSLKPEITVIFRDAIPILMHTKKPRWCEFQSGQGPWSSLLRHWVDRLQDRFDEPLGAGRQYHECVENDVIGDPGLDIHAPVGCQTTDQLVLVLGACAGHQGI